MSYRFTALLCLSICACSVTFSQTASAIIRCEMNGKSVNPNNGFETATLTGMLRCRDEDSGKLQREQELRQGKYIGLERFFDRDGRLERERSVNERGNSQGIEKQFWPNGQLKSEGTSDDGQTRGVTRRYFESGKIERIGFYQDRQAVLEISFNADGSYYELRCPAASTIAEDRKPCGFAGKTETVLQSAAGKRRALQSWEQGRLLALITYRDDGSVVSEMSFDQGRRMHRTFTVDGASSSTGKNVLREERVYELSDQPLNSTVGRLQTSKLWGSNGQATELVHYGEGGSVQVKRWYLNGALKEKSNGTGSGNTARGQREKITDDGKLASRETLTAEGTATGLQQYFYANGKLRREETYGEPDSRGRTRMLARKEWDEAGKLTADDEILEDGSRKRK